MVSDIFRSLSSELVQYWKDIEAQSGGEVLTFPCTETDRLGRVLFSNLKKGGFCTHLVTGRDAWNCRSEFFEAARAAAKRSLKIERAFLLPDRYLRHDQSLWEHLDLDIEAGIHTSVLDVGELVSALALPPHVSLDYGIWDDEVCCSAVYHTETAANGPSEWRLSARKEDVRLYRDAAKILKSKAPTVPLGAASPSGLDEPVLTTAPMARMVAPVLCRVDREAGESCSWYHGFWQYLRIFKLAPTPEKHTGFFLDALGSLAHDGKYGRVLISGAADYCMLAHVLRAYRNKDARAHVTVVDLCDTPLYLCKWYAKLMSHPIDTRMSDIFEFKTDKHFDVICTQSLLSRYSDSMKKALVSKWRELLRPGGKIVTTVNIKPSWSGDPNSFTPRGQDAFCERVHERSQRWRDIVGIDPHEMAKDARLYAERSVHHPFRSREELVELFEGGGFTFDRLNVTELQAKFAAYGQSRPSSRRTYGEFVASRPWSAIRPN